MAFAVCIPKKIHSISVFCFWILESELLSAEASFSRVALSFESSLLFGRPSLRTKDVDIPFCTELSVGIIGIYGIGSDSYPYSFIRIQSFKRIPSLNALNERCSMNDMPSNIIDLCKLDGLVFLASEMGRT